MAMAALHQSSTAVPWLFSRRVDLIAFGGSAALAFGLVIAAWVGGWIDSTTPEWTWVVAILMVDVAHVWATGFRVYFDPSELQRRPWLYGLTPLLGWLLGVCLYSESETLFWRCLAYLAVFHFVRQQAGWVALYRAREVDRSKVSAWLDRAAIYAATIWPLIWWHGHLPRMFRWFRDDDFVELSADVADRTAPIYYLLLACYVGHSLYRGLVLGRWNPGKDLVVSTTAICWYLGIVALNSDYVFTVTNVLIHGIPYLVLVQWFRVHDASGESDSSSRPRLAVWIRFLLSVWVLAYLEELFWDRGVWHEREWLFGAGFERDFRIWLVPLLAVPQLTHYVLDGFLWKRRSNPSVASFVQARAKG